MSRKNCHAQSYATPAQRWNQYQYKSYSNASFQCFRHCSSPFAVLIDFISMTRIWVQLLVNIRWLIYYLWWSIANWNSHFSFLHHMSEANASYLEWDGKCFITKLLHLKRLHFYEARLSAYEAFCGKAAKYEAPLMRYEAKPFQASCFFCLESRQKKWRREWDSNPRLFSLWNHA